MSARAEEAFAVDGRRFHLSLARSPNGLTVSCDPEEGSGPLGSVVVTAWMRDPSALLRSIDGRTGMSFEEDVGFEYDELDPTRVAAFAFSAEETVSSEFFARFVVAFGLACLDAAGRLGVDAGESVRSDLLARR